MAQFDAGGCKRDGVWGGRKREVRQGNRWEKGGKQKKERKEEGNDGAPASLQPCSGGGLLPALDQDSLECEARISIWGIGRNV